jgi:hypothetical protein
VIARAATLEVLRPGSLRRDMIMAQSLTSVAAAAEYLTVDERIHFKPALAWLEGKHPSTDSPHALDELHSTLGVDRWHLSCATAHVCLALLHHMYAAPKPCRGRGGAAWAVPGTVSCRARSFAPDDWVTQTVGEVVRSGQLQPGIVYDASQVLAL